jgi:hypothetical protein
MSLRAVGGPKLGEKVFLGDRKTPFRVIGFCAVEKEPAVELAAQGDTRLVRGTLRLKPDKALRARIPIANLIKDRLKRGWRERWRQQDLFDTDLPATIGEPDPVL